MVAIERNTSGLSSWFSGSFPAMDRFSNMCHNLAKNRGILIMKISTAALIIFFSAPHIIMADPASECGGSSQVEIGRCVADTLQRVDATVDMYLGFAMSTAREYDQSIGRSVAEPALEAAQAAWSDFRDAHCDYVGTTFGGGSGRGIGINSCRIVLGRDRADVLMRYIR
ncbi:DUF1311 domain-containing protein [Aliiroseovarius sp. KMU-50]|uniref:DUF1311 domain-containing protein n=1 Tax=Aliiroseovarius salicola TaxID=3009082 RepID=A0ABT4VYS5_9RHOB|nr:lysozyme inhibitor LprI family protein [Aliiroseovarius sp. KMU-50]MDA5093402.1 DUF1311 domain-containing protein [Aliiroseovarius sp. KMU-50]